MQLDQDLRGNAFGTRICALMPLPKPRCMQTGYQSLALLPFRTYWSLLRGLIPGRAVFSSDICCALLQENFTMSGLSATSC